MKCLVRQRALHVLSAALPNPSALPDIAKRLDQVIITAHNKVAAR